MRRSALGTYWPSPEVPIYLAQSILKRGNEHLQSTLIRCADDELIASRVDMFRAGTVEVEIETLNNGSNNNIQFSPSKTSSVV